jgi:2'-5' RNA ligase
MRTFIAIELEPDLRRPLIKLLNEVLPPSRDVRWCTQNQLHVTLKFLGEVRADQLPQVCAAAQTASAQVPPFSLRIKGLGGFPSPRSPRVLWCGVDDPTGSCRRWVELADPLFARLGFTPESRAFTPHITLGRSRGPAGGRVLREALETAPPPETEPMTVRQIIVFESRLLPTGAEYTPLATLPLAAG